MASAGAKAALQGYRLQALYILSRILSSRDPQGFVFQPERLEDLAIFATSGELREVIQVKAYSDNLTLSKFEPEKNSSFFRRVLELAKECSQTILKVASFGAIGPELAQAWERDGDQRRAVTNKLSDLGYTANEVTILLGRVTFIKEEEEKVRDLVFEFLRQSLVGSDPKHAFDLLSYWLYKAAENQRKITYNDLIAKLNSVGQYFAERAAHHQEWFTSIVPLEDNPILQEEVENLAEEFYQGVAARYEHILAEVDVVREEKLREIDEALRQSKVVIIRGASGQGKSTLAYRYLHDFVPAQWRFVVRLVKGRLHALRVAKALAGHLHAVNVPMYVYIDVSQRDTDWPDLVRELIQYQDLYILISIREEDWKRANVSAAEILFPKDIELTFDEKEARSLYSQLVSQRTSDQFLSFNEAWSQFGTTGPLLEFAYLVAKNQSLRERLAQQIRRLQDEVRHGNLQQNELIALRLIVIASAYCARIDQKLLADRLQLADPHRTFELFEKEYLVRKSPDGRFLEGLHPIRSTLLAEYLTDEIFTPWIESATSCLPMIVEDDLEIFLLHAFSQRSEDVPKLLTDLLSCRPQTWAGAAGIFRALLWLGVHDYVLDNEKLIIECVDLVGSGWTLILDFDVAGAAPSAHESLWQSLIPFLGQNLPLIDSLRKRQSSKEKIFSHTKAWVREHPAISAPKTLMDWRGLAEMSFWIGHRHIESSILSSFTETDLEEALMTLPLQDFGDVSLGLSLAWGDRFFTWLSKQQTQILTRFQTETQTVAIEDDGETARAHFLVNLEGSGKPPIDGQQASNQNKDLFNSEAVLRVELLRKLLPYRQAYGCQGYGHQLGTLKLPFDPTTKTAIPKESIPPSWAVTLNALFRNLANQRFRLSTWQEYAQEVFERRKLVEGSLHDLKRALTIHFHKRKPVNILEDFIDSALWDKCRNVTDRPPTFPQCAVDEWGFSEEGQVVQKQDTHNSATTLTPVARVLTLAHQPYLSAVNDFLSSLSNFFSQAVNVLALHPFLGKAKTKKLKEELVQKAEAQEVKNDTGRLSALNFTNALKALPIFQREFRKRFVAFFSEEELAQLEKDEKSIFWETWNLWSQFVFHPEQRWDNPVQMARRKAEAVLTQFRTAIRQNLRRGIKGKAQGKILSEAVQWNGKPALWLAFDVEDPLDLYVVFEIVLETLRAAIGTGRNREELQLYLIELQWPETFIIPLVKGKGLERIAWRVRTAKLWGGDNGEESNLWNYIPIPIPEEIWKELGLVLWEHERFEIMNRCRAAVVSLSLLVAQLCDFERIPKTNEVGQQLLDDQVAAQSQIISATCQQALDTSSAMMTEFNSLALEESLQRPALTLAMQRVIDMVNNIFPKANSEGTVKMNLTEAREWLHRLEAARSQVEAVRLLWTADVLKISSGSLSA